MTEKFALPEADTPAAIELRREANALPYAAPDGEFFARVGRKYLKNAGVAVFHMLGGVERMAKWADENPDDFYTKIYPKLLDKTVEVHDMRSIEDVISELDEVSGDLAIDAEFERV